MTEKIPRVCPECGGDRWKARAVQRQYEAAARMTESAEKLARENGLLRFQRDEARAETKRLISLQQRKVVRQARVIRRLEERLKALNVKPYEGAPIGETAPGAEYDNPESLER